MELTNIVTAYGNKCLEGLDRQDFELLMGMHRRIIRNVNGESVNVKTG
jgi:hypothetical protein